MRVALLLRLACAYGMAANGINRAKLTSTTVSLAEVLSTCVDAASRGCAEISAVQSRRDAGGELSVAMKDQADVRSALTEADLAAQRAMIGALRSAWPGLMIIGEEDEDESAGAADDVTGPPLRRDLCAELGVPGLEAPLEELCVFVDPLDGVSPLAPAPLHSLLPQPQPQPSPSPSSSLAHCCCCIAPYGHHARHARVRRGAPRQRAVAGGGRKAWPPLGRGRRTSLRARRLRPGCHLRSGGGGHGRARRAAASGGRERRAAGGGDGRLSERVPGGGA